MFRPLIIVRCAIYFILGSLLFTIDSKAADPLTPLDETRVAEIQAWLPESPVGVGPTIEQREVWDAAAKLDSYKSVIRSAESYLKQEIPELTDDVFLDFSRTGNRSRGQRVLSARHRRVSTLVLAECLENKGRFLPAIEEAILAVCDENTWVLPAHDRSLKNFHGQTNEIDLVVADVSWNLAIARYWLGDRLSESVRQRVVDELERRTFSAYETNMKTGVPRLWWTRTTNNWNAVCLAGTVGSALATIESRERRARFIAAAEIHIRNFFKGFTSDGYCSEGIGYWNYGFGHFVELAETLRAATGGKLDLYADEKVRAMSLFGPRMEIVGGVYPALADCSPGSRPSSSIIAMTSRRLDLGFDDLEQRELGLQGGPSGSLHGTAIYSLMPTSADSDTDSARQTKNELRSWFPDAGVLISRPAPDTDPALAMGVAMKAGHNGEHHNHNDVGTFLIALGGTSPLVDPGAEVYTARTFSSRRYDSVVLNSLGHPVPRIDGKLQRPGSSYRGVVLETNFTDAEDKFVIDMTGAYKIEGVKSLVRTFVYTRKPSPQLTVTDHLVADRAMPFETALITYAPLETLEDGTILVGDEGSRVRVTIEAGSDKIERTETQIDEDVRVRTKPRRLGFAIAGPKTETSVTIKIVPLHTK